MSNELILVVEDDPKSRKLLHDVLEFKGYRSQEAETAEEGLRLVGVNRPALILMDIQLPGMSGIDALKLLHGAAETSDIPVIAVTASVMERQQSDLIAAGFDDIERKPISVASLLGKMRKLLDRPKAP
jgi:two-component system, cell cycle response regulator DivK